MGAVRRFGWMTDDPERPDVAFVQRPEPDATSTRVIALGVSDLDARCHQPSQDDAVEDPVNLVPLTSAHYVGLRRRRARLRRAFCIYRFGTQSSYYLLIAASTSLGTMNAMVIEERKLSGCCKTVCPGGAPARLRR